MQNRYYCHYQLLKKRMTCTTLLSLLHQLFLNVFQP